MQKWEYMSWLVIGAGDVKNKGGKIKFVNYQEIANWERGVPVSEALRQAGRDGWELVQIDANSIYHFKRPISG